MNGSQQVASIASRNAQRDFRAPDGVPIFVYRWLPDMAPRVLVQIFDGLAEHAGRYARLAEALTNVGCVVYAADNRGHGRTARTPEEQYLSRADGTPAAHWLAMTFPAGNRAAFRLAALVVALPFGFRLRTQLADRHGWPSSARWRSGASEPWPSACSISRSGTASGRRRPEDIVASVTTIVLSHYARSELTRARQARAERLGTRAVTGRSASAERSGWPVHFEPARIKSTAERSRRSTMRRLR